MGYSGFWVVARSVTEERMRELGLEPAGEGAAEGWLFGDGLEPVADLHGVVAELSSDGGAAVGAMVHDSDFALLVVSEAGSPVGEVIVNVETAREAYGIPDSVAASSDADAFAAWTRLAPRQVDAASVREVLEQDWPEAEEGAATLLARA